MISINFYIVLFWCYHFIEKSITDNKSEKSFLNKKPYINVHRIFIIMHIILHNEWRKIEIDRNKIFLSGIWNDKNNVCTLYVILTSLKMVNVGEWSDVELELGKDWSKMVFVWCLKRIRRLPTRRIESEPQKFCFLSTEYRLLFRNIFLGSSFTVQQNCYITSDIFIYRARTRFVFIVGWSLSINIEL